METDTGLRLMQLYAALRRSLDARERDAIKARIDALVTEAHAHFQAQPPTLEGERPPKDIRWVLERRRLAAFLVRAQAMLRTEEDSAGKARTQRYIQDIERQLLALDDQEAMAPAATRVEDFADQLERLNRKTST